jgi:hypothetical protein
MGYNGIAGTLPEDWSALVWLLSLDLYRNQIVGTIPNGVADLKAVELFSLGDNALVGVLPSAIAELRTVKTLNLHDNRFTGAIPSWIAGLTALTSLSVHKNKLTGVVPALPFKNYTIRCMLQDTKSPTNLFDCPLPPGSEVCNSDGAQLGQPTCACTGSSANLATADCGWWGSFYDTTGGGTHWANCRGNRSDPCACRYTDAGGGSRGVTCKGSHITGL